MIEKSKALLTLKPAIKIKWYNPLLLTGMVLSLFWTSCQSGPGEGGTSVIQGKVFIEEYNSIGLLVDEYFAQEERVYLIYGEDSIYSDEMRTSLDGSYRFSWLRKGQYRVFAYSDCDTCPGQREAIVQQIEITSAHQNVTSPLMILRKN